jgi:type I site-specific restriction endonuclease
MGKTPRYYQMNAINAAVDAIAKGQDRLLLVMATGTGKTFAAFQIIWRLWKSGAKKRILFLADRNVLVDQTMVNDFRPFSGAMAKLSTHSKNEAWPWLYTPMIPMQSKRTLSTMVGFRTTRLISRGDLLPPAKYSCGDYSELVIESLGT